MTDDYVVVVAIPTFRSNVNSHAEKQNPQCDTQSQLEVDSYREEVVQ